MDFQRQFRKLILGSSLLFLIIPSIGEGIEGHQNRRECSYVRYASHFSVEYLKNGLKRLTDGDGREILLIHQEKDIHELSPGKALITIPVKRVVTRWSTIPSLLRSLSVMHTIVGVTMRRQEVCNEVIKRWLANGKVKAVGAHGSIDYEKLYAIDPDVFFVSKWEKTDLLGSLGIPYVVTAEYLEEHPLGRLEWVKFFAVFYDKEKQADALFNETVEKVNKLTKTLDGIGVRPKVLWGFLRRDGTVYARSGNSYVNMMITMAGGDFVFKQIRKDHISIGLEQFYKYGRGADVYICPQDLGGYGIDSIKRLLTFNPILSDFKSIKNGNVWYVQPWYWDSIDKTDQILEDLAAIFHPEFFPEHKVRYFTRLLQGE